MKRMKKKPTHSVVKPRSVALIVVAIVLAAAIYTACARIFHIWPLRHTAAPASDYHTTSTAPSAQDNFKGDKKPVPQTTPEPSATGTDQNGAVTNQPPDQSTWSKSPDGHSIIVYAPAKNSTFTSGGSVFGAASSATVSYRLSDAVSGLLTSGTVNVVDGKFSIKLSFSSSASTGNIEVFTQQDSYGPESNNVLIPVRF